MSKIEIDVQNLTEEQLAALKFLDAEAYYQEKQRRFAYPTVNEGLDDIIALAQRLEEFTHDRKRTELLRDYIDPLLLAITRTKAAR